MKRRPPAVALAVALAAIAGCGAKTGLLIPDAGEEMDAAIAECPDVPVPLRRTEVETTLVVDGSGSMGFTWDGLPGGAGLPTRWSIVRDSLASVLPAFDDRMALGAKIFPDGPECEITGELDVRPHLGATDEVLALFDRWTPEGGTPAAQALRLTLRSLGASSMPRVIVAVLDGAPNCNDEPAAPPETCVCTGPRRACLRPPPDGPRNCLDDVATLAVVREAYRERGIPVVVIGIDDPTRPELSEFLDQMAIEGGWPRPTGSDRRFYVARRPEDLDAAFSEIAGLISRCVLIAERPVPEDATAVVRVGGRVVPQDLDHEDGWDWTDRAAGALAFFGPSCDAVREGDVPVTLDLVCPDR